MLIIALVATVWGFGFPMTRIVLDGGLSVGALMGLRFPLAGLLMFAIIRAKGIPITRRGMVDGTWLGLVLVVVFWLQSDGMRFTTTAKAGFITGLYVLFTPLVAVAIGQRVKLASALGAVIATYGMYLLVHLPGGLVGWLEPGRCGDPAVRHFVRCAHRDDGRIRAPLGGVAACRLAGGDLRRGFRRGHRILAVAVRISNCRRGAFPLASGWRGALSRAWLHGVCVLGTSHSANQARSDGVGGVVQPGACSGGHPQRGLAKGADVAAAGAGRRTHRGGNDRRGSAAVYVPGHHGAGHEAVKPVVGG